MAHFTDVLVFPLKFMFVSVFVAADVFLLVLLINYVQALGIPSYTQSIQLFAQERPPSTKVQKDKQKEMLAIDAAIGETFKGIGSAVASSANYAGNAVGAAASAVDNAVGSAAHTVGSTVSNIAKTIATPVTNPEAIIKPEPGYELPEIHAVAPTVPTPTPQSQTAPHIAQAAASSEPESSSLTVWPLRGMVTTEFGTYHEPYQPRHTGIDISSHLAAGGAPITTFREGIVIDTIRSRQGLGNHIIVDHGAGLTSLYGHLSSIVVREGEVVKPGDIIGHEGDTGTSTGPHLHFEIHHHNQPLNPRNLVPGNP